MTSPGLRFALKARITRLKPVIALPAVAFIVLHAVPLAAQRQYSNTHAGGPLRVADAIPEARGEVELRLPSVRLDHPDAGRTQWRFDPSLSFAASSRTSVELGSSFAWFDRLTQPRGGLTGFDVGLNQVIATGGGAAPVISVALDAFVPAGALRSGGVWSQLRAMATGTRGRSRAHMNGAIGTYRVEVVDLGATCRTSSLLTKLGLTCDGSAPILPGGPCATINAPGTGQPAP